MLPKYLGNIYYTPAYIILKGDGYMNFIEPLTDSMFDTINLLCKSILDIFNIKHIDFTKFFNDINMKNKSNEIPKLRRKWEDDNYMIY